MRCIDEFGWGEGKRSVHNWLLFQVNRVGSCFLYQQTRITASSSAFPIIVGHESVPLKNLFTALGGGIQKEREEKGGGAV